jgi:hypothetical protein
MGAYNIINASSLVAGLPEDVSQVLANFQAIATILNGGIDDSNINAAAAMAISKLAGYPADAAKFLKGDGTWAVPSILANASVGNKISDLPAGTAGAQAVLTLLPVAYNTGGATALPAATITVSDTSEFPTAGTVSTPNGDIAYTGKTQALGAATLTGCTGGTGTLAANAVITLKTGTPSSPYDRVSLVYDSLVSKWVSPTVGAGGNPQFWVPGNQWGYNPAAGTWQEQLTTEYPILVSSSWRKYDAAGLKPQAQVMVEIASGAPTGFRSRVHWRAMNMFDAPFGTNTGADTNSAGPQGPGTTNVGMVLSTLWADLPGGYTVKDVLGVSVDTFATNTVSGQLIAYARTRWTS